LLVKIALFLVMLAIAAVNRMRLTPRLVGGGAAASPALRQLRTNALIEAVIGALILLIVAVLGTLPPGREDADTTVAASQLGKPVGWAKARSAVPTRSNPWPAQTWARFALPTLRFLRL
jgi:hypothetical protein